MFSKKDKSALSRTRVNTMTDCVSLHIQTDKPNQTGYTSASLLLKSNQHLHYRAHAIPVLHFAFIIKLK